MARLGVLLTAIAVLVAAAAPNADAGPISFGGGGLTGSAKTHANQFTRDGFPSLCGDGGAPSPPILTPDRRTYQSFAFTSLVNEPLCVTVDVTAPACAAPGPNEVMSETYSPAYDPENITTNWIGDLGNSPPSATSYSVVVPAGARFETVLDEVLASGNCTGVNATWSSDRPWAARRPNAVGVPAVGQTLTDDSLGVWSGNPTIGHKWKRCDAAGANCTDIPGATGQSYVPTDDDIGHTLRPDESASDGLTSTVNGETTTRVFIPVATHESQSVAAGDAATPGHLSGGSRNTCDAPKPTPTQSGTEFRFYDSFAVTSLINEPSCIWVAQVPRAGTFCVARLSLYSPAFDPADLRKNYLADDTAAIILAGALPAGASAQAIFADDGQLHMCSNYGLVVGADVPFATARPQLDGGGTEGTAIKTTNGVWGGAPAFAHAWRRCDASGGNCAPIDGATGAAYTPTAADVGSTLRSRVTATRGGRSASSDSAPSAVIATAPPGTPGGPGGSPGGGGPGGGGGGGGPGAGDGTAPTATLALARTTLQKVVKKKFIPVNVTCDEAAAITVRADVTRKLGKRLGGVKIASGKGTCQVGKRVTIKVKLTRKARKGLRRMKSIAFTLKATASDAAGNTGTATRKGRIKRRR